MNHPRLASRCCPYRRGFRVALSRGETARKEQEIALVKSPIRFACDVDGLLLVRVIQL